MTYRRTVVALLLTLTAVTLPSAAWFVAGRRQLDRELGLREKGVYSKGYKKGVTYSERLAVRLEVLREAESRRPFYHYQNLYHDPEAATEGIVVQPSPLAQGPDDPLIRAHFQVDDDGRLTLPTINDELPELGLESTDSAHCDLLEELRDVAFFCLGEFEDFGLIPPAHDPPADRGSPEISAEEVEVLALHAWHQHLQANVLYADLKYARQRGDAASGLEGTPRDDAWVEIVVSPFRWHTLPVGEDSGLVALRKVETPVGVWTQGFVISPETVAQELVHSDFPATFASLEELELEGRHRRSIYPVAETGWGVALDVSERLAGLRTEASAERGRFMALFLLGALGAGLAGLLVVTMVFQSERLALQRGQFAASAAHELRTPLAGLRLYGEMLAEGMGHPERARDYARRMAAEAERLGRVVTNVLSFTRLERKSLQVHPEPGDLAAAVRDALERQKASIEEAGADLEIDLPADLPPVSFDRDAVANIVQNLLDNAEKYTRGLPGRKIEVHLENGDQGVRLRVLDNGPGVAPAVRRRLFRPFSRGQHDGSAEGLGLGLVLVRALARAQGGDIRYRERSAGGAEFTVTFTG